MRNFGLIAVFLLSLAGTLVFAQEWNELKGEHFLVYYDCDKEFARDVLHKAELNYDRIALDLGYSRISSFWTWSNRVKIYLYRDYATYIKLSGHPEWSQGMADYTNKMILSYSGNEGFLNSILPHEIAHLIFRDFVGFKGEVPLWLDEGVAQWEEEIDKSVKRKAAGYFLEAGRLISIKDLMNFNLNKIKQSDSIQLRFRELKTGKQRVVITGIEDLVRMFYLESASLAGFLIERYGADSFTVFCRNLRDGKNLEDALRQSYPNSIQTIEQLEKKYTEYLLEKPVEFESVTDSTNLLIQ